MNELLLRNVSKRWLTKHAIVSLGMPLDNHSYDCCPIVITKPEQDELQAVYAHNWREITVEYKDIYPCPIDNYILIKLGFQGSKEGKIISYTYDAQDYTVSLTRNFKKRGEWMLSLDDEDLLSVSFVHVMQNVLLLLTNSMIIMNKQSCSRPSEDFDEDLFKSINY